MDMRTANEMRFAVGVFMDAETLEQAYRELSEHGVKEGEVCIMAPRSILSAGTRRRVAARDQIELQTDSLQHLMARLKPTGAHCAGGAVYASSGNLSECLGDGTHVESRGLWISDVLSRGISKRAAQYFEDRLGEGKILMWVLLGRRSNVQREQLACSTLLTHASESLRVLDFALRN